MGRDGEASKKFNTIKAFAEAFLQLRPDHPLRQSLAEQDELPTKPEQLAMRLQALLREQGSTPVDEQSLELDSKGLLRWVPSTFGGSTPG